MTSPENEPTPAPAADEEASAAVPAHDLTEDELEDVAGGVMDAGPKIIL